MIERLLKQLLVQRLGSGKALIIQGARQTGKTTLLQRIFNQIPHVLWLNADEADTRAIIENS